MRNMLAFVVAAWALCMPARHLDAQTNKSVRDFFGQATEWVVPAKSGFDLPRTLMLLVERNRPNKSGINPILKTENPIDLMNGLPEQNENSPARRGDGTRPMKPMSHVIQTYQLDTTLIFSSDTLRQIFTYDSRGKIATYLLEHWLNGEWVKFFLTTNTFNANGRILTRLGEGWQDGELTNAFLDTSTYDANGNQLTSLQKYWMNGQWADSILDTYTYDADGNILTSLRELRQGGQWVNANSGNYTYDANGDQLTSLQEGWQNGEWVNAYAVTSTYDTNSHQLTSSQKQWLNGEWINSNSDTSIYDTNGNLLAFLQVLWQNGQWENAVLSRYTYDSSGKILSDQVELWQNGQWTNSSLDTYMYDADGNQVTFLNGTWQNGEWTTIYKMTSIWGAAEITAVRTGEPVVPASFSLSQNYPNPFNPTTKIEYRIAKSGFVSLKVYNLLGQEVVTLFSGDEQPGNYSATFDGSKLASGLYFYRLTAQGYSKVMKMLMIK
jgi:Secretion system C-terminal sorting domain